MTEAPKHIHLGIRQMNAGNPRGAIKHFRDAISIDPDILNAHINLALCLLETAQHGEALEEAAIALRLAPEHYDANYAAGAIHLRRGKRKLAYHFLAKALALAPWDIRIHQQLAHFYETGKQRKKAMAVLEEGLVHQPNNAGLLADLGRLLLLNGRVDDAEDHAMRALRLDPDNVDGHTLMGLIKLRAGLVEEAHKHASLALRINPTNPESLRLLASVKIRSNPSTGLWWYIAITADRIGPRTTMFGLGMLVAIVILVPHLIGLEPGILWDRTIMLFWFGFIFYLTYWNRNLQKIIAKDTEKTLLKPDF